MIYTDWTWQNLAVMVVAGLLEFAFIGFIMYNLFKGLQ